MKPTDLEIFLKPIAEALLIILIGAIKFPKMKFNLWTMLARWVGRAINREMLEQMTEMREELTAHIKSDIEENITNCRRRILRFDDEILHKEEHSREHFCEILEDIDRYEKYCKANPLFPNNKCSVAIQNIKTVYQKCHAQHKFLSE